MNNSFGFDHIGMTISTFFIRLRYVFEILVFCTNVKYMHIECWFSLFFFSNSRCSSSFAVTSSCAQWRLKSPTSHTFTETFVQAQIKENIKARVTGVREGIHRWPEDSPRKGTVTRKMFPFGDVITSTWFNPVLLRSAWHSDGYIVIISMEDWLLYIQNGYFLYYHLCCREIRKRRQ